MIINSVTMTISAFKAQLSIYYSKLVNGDYKRMSYNDFKYVKGIVENGNNVVGYPCSCKAPKLEIRLESKAPSDFSFEDKKVITVYCDTCGQKAHTFEFDKDFAEHLSLLRKSGVKALLEKESFTTTKDGRVVEVEQKQIENKGDNDMMNMNLDFGMVTGDDFRLSHVGLAVKTAQGYRAYDKVKEEVVDVDIFNFTIDGMIMKMPVAIKNITTGDVVIHQGSPMIVRDVKDKTIEVVNLEGSEIKNILPVKNAFGFNFYTKIVSLIDMGNLGANDDSPFGNMLPLMMMGGMNGKMDMNSMMPLLLMSGGKMDKNMMLMMAMMNGGDSQMNPLMMMAMMGGGDLFGGLCDSPVPATDMSMFELPKA